MSPETLQNTRLSRPFSGLATFILDKLTLNNHKVYQPEITGPQQLVLDLKWSTEAQPAIVNPAVSEKEIVAAEAGALITQSTIDLNSVVQDHRQRPLRAKPEDLAAYKEQRRKRRKMKVLGAIALATAVVSLASITLVDSLHNTRPATQVLVTHPPKTPPKSSTEKPPLTTKQAGHSRSTTRPSPNKSKISVASPTTAHHSTKTPPVATATAHHYRHRRTKTIPAPKTLAPRPTTVHLTPGDNPWVEAQSYLEKNGNPHPTAAQIQAQDTKSEAASGITSAWQAAHLPVGFQVVEPDLN